MYNYSSLNFYNKKYAALQHNTPPVKVVSANLTYSTLDTTENTEEKDSKEYSTLNHEQDKKRRRDDKANNIHVSESSQLDVHIM